MSEVLAHEADGTVAEAAPAPEAKPVTAGALLYQARQAAGLHVAALAVALKVPVRKLEALESDRYELLSDAVFVRALAASVCRTLKIDPQPVLDRLPQTAAPRLLHDSDGLNAPFRGPRDGAAPGWFDQLSKPVILAVFGLLLGALVLILLPRAQQEGGGPGQEATSPDAAAATLAETPAAAAPVSLALPVSEPQTGVAASLAKAPAAPAVPDASGAGTAVAAGTASATTDATAPDALASGIVVFRAKAESWVEVTDAKGVTTLRRLLAAGESGAASGALPLQVTVGRADATQVRVRGKPFDLRPVSRDNVARFEVK